MTRSVFRGAYVGPAQRSTGFSKKITRALRAPALTAMVRVGGRAGQGEEGRLKLGRPPVGVGGEQAGRERGDPHHGVARARHRARLAEGAGPGGRRPGHEVAARAPPVAPGASSPFTLPAVTAIRLASATAVVRPPIEGAALIARGRDEEDLVVGRGGSLEAPPLRRRCRPAADLALPDARCPQCSRISARVWR